MTERGILRQPEPLVITLDETGFPVGCRFRPGA
jgi:hypothetical protein